MFEENLVEVSPPRLVWVRQVGGGGEDYALPGLLHRWRRKTRRPRWEGLVTMFDGQGRRSWHGWMNEKDLAPWAARQA